jgi:lipopolysaccharide cholinephosphotransferase
MYRVYDDETLNKLHETLIELLDEFVRICKKHNLKYTLVAGTVLGAVRHSGFIPWDDDIDVGMLRPDYEKFLEVAPKELKDKYILDCFEQNKDYHLSFAKIKKNGTIFDEEAAHHMNNHKGIFLDVFPLDNVYDNVKRSYINAALIKIVHQTVCVKKKIYKIKDCRHKIMSSILMVFPHAFLMKLEKKLCTMNKDNNSKYIACFLGVYPFKKEVSERKDFFPTKEMVFEKKKYSVLNNTDKYLSSIYGDYMKLPPKEKRVNHMPLKIDFGEENED